jgi:cobalamin biosynthesis Co2+ chelatase CbiK
LGIDESLEEFLGDAIEGYSINTPAGYTLTVIAENVKDQNGVIVRTPESVINSIKTAFSNQGKTFIFVGETSAG